MHRIIVNTGLFFFVIFSSVSSFGQTNLNQSISHQTQVSLVTCAPGTALFEAFGHTAIRIHDPVSGFDMAYNYGVFDFNQPNFYLNFAKGYLLYKLGTADFSRFLYQYAYFDRTVQEQVLNLTDDQKQAVFSFLQINSLPENREYYYDYFFDNCATRPRDVFIKILGDSLQFEYGYADTLNFTIRDLIDYYIEDRDQYAWGDLGIDLGLGANIDRQATPFEYMYQPEFLFLAFAGGTVKNPDGSLRPLVATTNILYQGTPQSDVINVTFTPTIVLWLLLLFLIIATVFEYRRKKYSLRFFDIIFFSILGLFGLVVVFLWFFTNHTAAANNWNLLWGWPTHLVAAAMLLVKRSPGFLKFYYLLTALITGFLLFFWALIPQDLHDSLIPLLMLIVLRSFTIAQLKFTHEKPAVAKA
ncbi:lipoprotein N-acyltransferase Lnb domain-containing protein [Catalinimonas niigatensis]|uniref:lipoprotein N-acyltransferase Lnb domain-containing protein n=1 Tax=Catalinimonas niigatensis TaxID=1397264 RepID=UPI002665CA14|nr:DUF4105 domain-containing protein [Catalinimonas niigatensis]WPP51026.1 DUF4105 domain-containing protein [Catalinimonas niigatensis]